MLVMCYSLQLQSSFLFLTSVHVMLWALHSVLSAPQPISAMKRSQRSFFLCGLC